MKPSRDPLYKAACRISRRLQQGAEHHADNAHATLLAHYQHLEQYCRAVAAQLRRVRTCADRGWSVSLQRCSGVLRPKLDTLFEQVKYLIYKPPDPYARPISAPRPDLILAELKQLREEFSGVEVKKGVIAVTTEPIRLQDVPLGPFSIRLHLDRMTARPPTATTTSPATPAAPAPNAARPFPKPPGQLEPSFDPAQPPLRRPLDVRGVAGGQAAARMTGSRIRVRRVLRSDTGAP